MKLRLPPHSLDLVKQNLLPWFTENARDLPWRRNRDPYAVWISETMLQQTRVDTVIPYFQRWMQAFPDCRTLARADQGQVLKLWEGLGYYARARNLHAAAQQVVARFDGELPADPEALLSLKGVGPYTLAAVMSLAFDQSYAVLDGNVERVLARYCAMGEDIRKPQVKKNLQSLATRLLDKHPPGMFNEAMMELGATVCTPGVPNCTVCPLKPACRGLKSGSPADFPYKSKKKPIPTVKVGAGVVWRDSTTFLIAQRKEKGMLGGLWEFPGGKVEAGESISGCIARELEEELGIRVVVGDELIKVRHSYTHFHLRMRVHHCQWQGDTPRIIDCADFRWVQLEECRDLPFSRADIKVLDALAALAAGTVGDQP
ncbi:A/G-specific adenine glycosylase [Kiritimatiellaeota bacterium B1221]|nr:A/G-specific adenine glycosylase [Kiritimatiellaeota bacterium B1221]